MTPPYLTLEEQDNQLEQASIAAPDVASAAGVPEIGVAPTATAPVQQAPGATSIPPPPPQVPGLPDFSRQIQDFSSQWMGQPNPYLSDLVTKTRAESEGRIANTAEEARRRQLETIASRGLTGSNLEGELGVRLEGEQQRAVQADERALQESLANYDLLGRQAAGAHGLDTLSALDEQGLARYMAGLEGEGLREGARQFDVTAGFTQQNIDQRAQQIVNEGRALDLQEARDIAARELGQQELGQQESQFARSLSEQTAGRLQQYGLSVGALELEVDRLQQQAQLEGRSMDISEAQNEAELNLRTSQLQQEAQLQGRSLDLQEARDQATQDIALAKMAQEGRQFEASLIQRQTEFASTIGLSREQFAEQTAQFRQQFGEQVASRLQQNEQFERALESDEARDALSVGLQSRALDLQEAGMTMEDAWRQASLDQERELTTRGQDLTEAGLNAEDAYRYAALEQSGDFQNEQIRLEELGLNMEQSYREAEQGLQLQQLGIQQQQVDQEIERLRQTDRSLTMQEARDQAQLDLAREGMQAQMDMQMNEINQRESEFARNMGLNEREFTAQQAQFTTQMAEQTASRLQQNTQFTTALESEVEQNALERGLRTRALDLQQTGMDADQAYRTAQQEFENGRPAVVDAEGNVIEEATLGYQDRVLQLQSEGMDADEAIRWAALEGDNTYRAEALRLQELGLTNEASYREAELRIRTEAMQQQWDMFSEQIEFDRQEMFSDQMYQSELIRLQDKGLDNDQAARFAELNYKENVLQEQREQFDDDLQFRMDQAETDADKFARMMDMWEEYYGKSATGGDPGPDVNVTVIGGTGTGDGTGGGTGDPRFDYPQIPTDGGEPWTWDDDRNVWVDGDGNEYEE